MMFATLTFVAIAGAGTPAVSPSASAPGSFVAIPGELEFSGELIVRPRQDLTAAQRKKAAQLLAPLARRHIAQTDEYMVVAAHGPEALGAPENRVASQLMATGLFQYAHPNWIVYPTVVPNDTRFGEQWHHTMMQSQLAWDLHTGNPSVVVAVTDTGIVTHVDLPNRVPGFNSVSHVPEAEGGDLTDINGHGTHVAGCAAAFGNNAAGVCGMGWNLSIMPIRVSEITSGSASYEALLDGARWAAENGAKVCSASYSGIGYDAQETTAEYMNGLGCSYLWAAGNSNYNHAAWDFPHLLGIGASDSADNKASFSGYGRGTDCFAPGVSILSTTKNGDYGFASGTSMATPVANGALGMVRSANPALSVKHAEHILLHTCDIWGGEQDNEQYGFGRVNLFKAVQDSINAFVPANPVARNDRAKGVKGQTFILDVLNNDYDRNMDPLQIQSAAGVTNMGDSVTVLPGGGPEGRDALQVQVAAGAAAGTRSVIYTMREPVSGFTMQATAFIEASAPRSPENPIGAQAGLDTKYYAVSASALPDFNALSPFMTEAVDNIDFPSTDGEFAGSGLADDVAATFDGWIAIPESGLWTLSIQSDDGSKLRIGANEINNDGLHGMVTKSSIMALGKGRHSLHVEFFERGGGAGLIMQWSGPNTNTQVVPPEALSFGGVATPADFNGDGAVDGADLGALLGAWGMSGVQQDLTGDGIVDGADLGMLLGSWSI